MRFCWPRLLFFLLVVVLGSTAMLNACGQKGPLKLPEKSGSVEPPASKPGS